MKGIKDPRTGNVFYPGMTDREHKLFLEIRTYAESHAARLGEPTRFPSGAILVPAAALADLGGALYIADDRVSCPNHGLYHDSLTELLAAINNTKETQ